MGTSGSVRFMSGNYQPCHGGTTGERAPIAKGQVLYYYEEIRALIFEEIASLSTPRQLTRYLCGLTSPATTRAKLTKRPEFARFTTTPFRTVLAQVEACWEEVG